MVDKYNLQSLGPMVTKFSRTTVIPVESEQLGAVKTILLASNLIDSDVPLLIHDGSHYVRWNKGSGIQELLDVIGPNVDAAIAVHDDNDPRWSYAMVHPGTTTVSSVQEKVVISRTACTGMYLWKSGITFLKAAQQMIKADKTVHGQFYVAPVHNEAIATIPNFKCVIHKVPKSLSLRSVAELKAFHDFIVPSTFGVELEQIYKEMRDRNEGALRKDAKVGIDAGLLAKVDTRRCHAMYCLATPQNWQPSTAFNEMMAQLAQVVQGTQQVLYKVLFKDPKTALSTTPSGVLDGALHLTFMQLIKFDLFSSVSLHPDYYKSIQAITVNWLPSFDVHFNSLVITPKSVILLGVPSTNINFVRQYLRRELSREGHHLYEPYVADLAHMTLMRFSSPLSSAQITQLLQLSQKYLHQPLGQLQVNNFGLSPSSWKMQPQELFMPDQHMIQFSLAPS